MKIFEENSSNNSSSKLLQLLMFTFFYAGVNYCSVQSQYLLGYLEWLTYLDTWSGLLTWILGVASKQLRLLHGRVEDSTTLVNSIQMSELVEDAIAS